MKPGPSRWLAFVVGGLAVVGLAAQWPAVAAGSLTNAAMLRAASAQPCDPAWYVCGHLPPAVWYPPQPLPGNEPALRAALAGFRRAAQLAPAARRASLHVAEMLFALGDRGGAARALTQAGWLPVPDPDLAASSLTWPAGSPLLAVARYEHYLARARQYAEAGRWPDAVTDYRLGLAYAGERATAQDSHDFFLAAANAYAAQSGDAETRLLAGKYFVLAGDWQRAVPTLQTLLAGINDLSPVQRAWAAYYLGRAYEQGDQPVAALDTYQAGWQASPEVRGNALQLIALLGSADPAQAVSISQALEAAGPGYPAGRTGAGYRFDAPAALPSGWVFAGYDLDPESLEQGGPLEAWLWWRPPASGASWVNDGSLLQVGGYVVQRQSLVNLVLNNAFEWGERPSGVPFGWAWSIYSEEPASLYVASVDRDDRQTRAVVAANPGWPSSGVLGLPAPVETEGWYLMAAAYLTQQAPNSLLGRVCEGPAFQARGPYYPPTPPAAPPDDVWIHLADLAPAFAGDVPEQCRLILINYENPGGTVMWDDLLLARVVPPAP